MIDFYGLTIIIDTSESPRSNLAEEKTIFILVQTIDPESRLCYTNSKCEITRGYNKLPIATCFVNRVNFGQVVCGEIISSKQSSN